MRLHRAGKVADWQRTKRGRYNTWQKIAAETSGWLTPANMLSIGGLLFVAYGGYLIIHADYDAGLLAVIIGRLADLVDGYVADKTETKSPLGEIIDVTCDKLAIVIVLPILALENLVPLYIIAAIVAQNIAVVSVSLLARNRAIKLHPGQESKLAVAASWLAVITFAFHGSLSNTQWQAWQDVSLVSAIISSIIFGVLGWLACFKYAQELRQPAPTNLSPTPEFTKILLVVNPLSSHARRVRGRARELQKLFPQREIDVIETTKEPARFRRKLTSQLSSNTEATLLCIGGGDGTVNLVLNILMQEHVTFRLANITLLPLWGGNANDFAYMLNGPSTRTTLKSLFAEAIAIPVHPFEITLTSPDKGPDIRYAACYASFGASAYAAGQLDTNPVSRKLVAKSPAGRFASEILQSAKALLDAPGFDIELKGKRVKIFEHVFVNGSRMAKFDRSPAKLNEKSFYRALRPEQEPFFLFYMRLLRVVRRKGKDDITSKPQSFTTEEKTWAQFDGEVVMIPPQTKVIVKHAKTPFYALSKKLKASSS